MIFEKKNKTKKTYRIRNWSEYNRSLQRRASLSLWIDEAAIRSWNSPKPTKTPGHPKRYHDIAIITSLTLAAVYRLPLRQCSGFVSSLFERMKIEIPVPDYTTLCRRKTRLNIAVPFRKKASAESLHIVVDSTGLKVFGEGEWKVRQHGYSKRRTWRKVHLAVDEKTGEILSHGSSSNACHDSEMMIPLLENISHTITQVSADGAYDSHAIYEYLKKRNIRAAIPTRRGAQIKRHGNCRGTKIARDQVVRAIRKQGRRQWKKKVGYHRRSLSETAMFRLKTIFGESLSSRIALSQDIEISLRCRALNIMTWQGMPNTVAR